MHFPPLAPTSVKKEDVSASTLIVKYKKLADVGQNYNYQITCVNEEGKTCLGKCDADSLMCEMKGLTAARKHEISLVACFTPTGISGLPVCGSPSPSMIACTLPMSKFRPTLN